MHRTYPFHDLSDDEFQTLVSAVCMHVLGIGTIVFSKGRDGGRDGKFEGVAKKFPSEASPLTGKFIVQAKHTSNPAGSCADSDFNRALNDEHPKIIKLIAASELEHYLVFSNRKKPADDAVAKEKALCELGLKTAHILGADQIRDWLVQHPDIWKNLGFDRFETKLQIRNQDLTSVITAFHSTLTEGKLPEASPENFTYVPKPEKNRINKLSPAYFDEIQRRSLPYFKQIGDFLRNPRNIDFKDMYEDTADEIRRKILTTSPPFESFDVALTFLIDLIAANNTALDGKRRFAAIFLHYMYSTCDIGQHADAVEAP